MQRVENYQVPVDGLNVDIFILKAKTGIKKYHLSKPKLQAPTEALLDEVKIELITQVSITSAEILDIKEIENIKQRFREKAKEILDKKLPNLDEKTTKVLISRLLQQMLGLGEIDCLLADESLEEIVINSSLESIRVYHKRYGWLETNIKPRNEPEIRNYSNIIARRSGRQITTLNPLLDAYLASGDRVNAVLHPVSSKGHTITIRKFARDPWTVTDFIKNKTCSSEIFSLIWLCIQYEMSILVSGGTASGKTSFLNVCMPFIPPDHRILSIEDTREVQLPTFLFWCPLTTREANPEGQGKVTMLDLLVNSLRMRPDRIIFGEVRKKRQAEVLFEALHTGHSIYSTVHADSMGETIRRLINPPIELPPNLLNGVDLNVVMFRDRKRGIRRVLQIGEFIDAEGESISVKPNVLFRWKSDTDRIVKHNEPIKLFEDLSKYTGMTLSEVRKELKEKQKILDWMVKNNVRSVEEVGALINEYYLTPNYKPHKPIIQKKEEEPKPLKKLVVKKEEKKKFSLLPKKTKKPTKKIVLRKQKQSKKSKVSHKTEEEMAMDKLETLAKKLRSNSKSNAKKIKKR